MVELGPDLIDRTMEVTGLNRTEARRLVQHVYDTNESVKIASCLDKDKVYEVREKFLSPRQLGAVESDRCDPNKAIGLPARVEKFDLAISSVKRDFMQELVALIIELTHKARGEVVSYIRSVNEQAPPVLFECVDLAAKDDLVDKITDVGATVIVISRDDCAP